MLRTGGQNELCHKYLLLKLMPLVAIYKKAVHREHSVEAKNQQNTTERYTFGFIFYVLLNYNK